MFSLIVVVFLFSFFFLVFHYSLIFDLTFLVTHLSYCF